MTSKECGADWIDENIMFRQYEYYCSKCKEYGVVKAHVFMEMGYIHKHNSEKFNSVQLPLICIEGGI